MKTTASVLALLLALFAVSCSRPQPSPTTVLIVRHAEKASDADDSPLTEAGVQRAQALVRVAEDSGASAVYTSQFKRNHDTAKPLSERLGVAVTEVPVNQSPGDYGKTLAGNILEKHSGKTVVVIGHSNTIAATIEGLTGRAAGVGDVQYGDLFIVTVPPSGPASVIKARFGS
ncbi:MAG TPA: phosphoglycerate mutase family protein [Pyrinomonadaceae bacterium]|nr:phosphoglycerate mutase family protein [Pyrinomonadaceae bacterium]